MADTVVKCNVCGLMGASFESCIKRECGHPVCGSCLEASPGHQDLLLCVRCKTARNSPSCRDINSPDTNKKSKHVDMNRHTPLDSTTNPLNQLLDQNPNQDETGRRRNEDVNGKKTLMSFGLGIYPLAAGLLILWCIIGSIILSFLVSGNDPNVEMVFQTIGQAVHQYKHNFYNESAQTKKAPLVVGGYVTGRRGYEIEDKIRIEEIVWEGINSILGMNLHVKSPRSTGEERKKRREIRKGRVAEKKNKETQRQEEEQRRREKQDAEAKEIEMKRRKEDADTKDRQTSQRARNIEAKERKTQHREDQIQVREGQMKQREEDAAQSKDRQIAIREEEAKTKEGQLTDKETQLQQREEDLSSKETQIKQREEEVKKNQLEEEDKRIKRGLEGERKLKEEIDKQRNSLGVLLSVSYEKQILEWSDHSSENQTMKLCCKATRDGFSAKAFHSGCDGKGKTMIIIESSEGHIFGGSSSLAWKSSGGWIVDPEAYIYTMKNPHNIPPTKYPAEGGGNIYHGSANLPQFGKGHDIRLVEYSNTNKTNGNNSYFNFPSSFKDTTGFGDSTFTGQKYFFIKDFEVYYLN